jgi:tetratricopeptide (TPR) repeat protein
MAERIVGFGAHKLEPAPWASRQSLLERRRTMLYRVLNMHTTVAFLGAGCSVPLGYPSWQQFVFRVVDFTLKQIRNMPRLPGPYSRHDIKKFQSELGPKNRVKSDRLLVILGACKRVLDQVENQSAIRGRSVQASYIAFLREQFKPRPTPAHALNPYGKLLGLPIRRFITSNYDCELELALAKKLNMYPGEFNISGKPDKAASIKKVRSFTQKPEYTDQLALFALARVEGNENMVFHCHGHYDDPESMIVTEADYQHWYLDDKSGAGIAFRQTIELLFGSNPILFVGYGLGDEDLLRPLRMFVSINPERKASRPLFALIAEPGGDKNSNWEYHDYLYERYGVNVIPYEKPESNDPGEWGEALCGAIDDIKQDWLKWRDEWLKKPKIRKMRVAVSPPAPYHHHSFITPKYEPFTSARTERTLEKLKKAAQEGARVIAIVGPGGTGKSWYAMQLMEELQHSGVYKGLFFWSSYYSDDSLTGIDSALAYLENRPGKGGRAATRAKKEVDRRSRLDRLADFLESDRYLLVFDGVERFLCESAGSDEGCTYSPNIKRFLEKIAGKHRSTIVLTSRLWPMELGEAKDVEESDAAVRRCIIPPITIEEVCSVKPFNEFDRSHTSALCSLLNGHIFGLVLAARLLEAGEKKNQKANMAELRRALSNTPPDRRESRIIREALRALDEPEWWNGLALKFLERVAVFMSPVTEQTIDICYRLALDALNDEPRKNRPRYSKARKDSLLRDLVRQNLIHEIVAESDGDVAYSMHPIIRGYIFNSVHRTASEGLPNFTLPGFTAGTAVVDPGTGESVELVKSVFKTIYKSAKETKRVERARSFCRSVFGVVRSRMVANAVPRWTNYDEYFIHVAQLGWLCKKVSPELWDYAESHNTEGTHHDDGPLYADELAWLYNEIGLTCYSEGAVLDALAVWEQGYEINRIIDSLPGGGQYLFQSQCNLGAAYIQLGRLKVAEKYLRDAERTNIGLRDDDHEARIMGYLALIEHLRGNLLKADSLYRDAMKKLHDIKRNPRAESIFSRHRADLRIKEGEIKEAKSMIQFSRALAEAARYPDLVALSRLTQGHVYRQEKDFPAALREYNIALAESRRIGIRSLEADALSELSRLALDHGDAQIARQRAIESLRIANELSLGLRQTHALVVLGLATVHTGPRELGIAYLRHAKALADQQEYWLRGREAEADLYKLGEPPKIS